MTALKLRQIGNSVGVIIPQEELHRLNLRSGDTVHLTNVPGGVRLTSYDPEFEAQMVMARKIMARHRNVLRALAK
jgi:putative addiction module antidote